MSSSNKGNPFNATLEQEIDKNIEPIKDDVKFNIEDANTSSNSDVLNLSQLSSSDNLLDLLSINSNEDVSDILNLINSEDNDEIIDLSNDINLEQLEQLDDLQNLEQLQELNMNFDEQDLNSNLDEEKNTQNVNTNNLNFEQKNSQVNINEIPKDNLQTEQQQNVALQEEEKKSFFSRIISFFKKEEVLDSRETLNDYSYEYSKFREYVFLLEDSEDDGKVLEAIELCDDSLKLDRHKLYLDGKRKECELILQDLKCYENLSEDDSKLLKTLITNYLQLNTERRGLRYQLGDFPSSINKLESIQEQAQDDIYQIEDAEKSKKLLKRDIALIKDEKERTLSDREKLQFAYKVLHKFSFAISIFLGIAIIVLTLISISANESMFFALSILCVTLVFTIALVYIFRRKIVFELKLNEKKYNKLITLLNKKTVVYSYYINFLNYSYKKYNVKSARALKNNLNDFSNYKHIITRYDNLGKLVFEVQKQLEDFLAEKKISISNTSLEAFAKSINIDNKISYFKEIDTKRQKIEARMEEITEEQQQLVDKLVKLNIEDTSKERVIEKILQAYLNETEKILSEEDEDDIKKIEEF